LALLKAKQAFMAKKPVFLPINLIIETELFLEWDSEYPERRAVYASSMAVWNPNDLSTIGISFSILLGITRITIGRFLSRTNSHRI